MSLFRTTVPGLCVILLCIATPPLAAQADDAVEYAATPTALLELLDANAHGPTYIDSYLEVTRQTRSREVNTIQHMRVRHEGEEIAVSISTHREDRDIHNLQTAAYSLEGEFRWHEQIIQRPDYFSHDTTTRDDDDTLHLSQHEHVDGEETTEESEGAYEPMGDNAIPMEWLPLAIGYHLRQGNTAFAIRLRDGHHGSGGTVLVWHFHLIESEEVDRDGVLVFYHLQAEVSAESNGQLTDAPPRTYTFTTVRNGAILEMANEDGSWHAEALDKDEAIERIEAMTPIGDTP